MNNRRNFIMQTGMAATAVLASQSLKVFSQSNSAFSFSGMGTTLVLLHSNNFKHHNKLEILKEIKDELKRSNTNMLLLDTGCNLGTTSLFVTEKSIAGKMREMQYDAIMPGSHDFENKVSMLRYTNTVAGSPVVTTNLTIEKSNIKDDINLYRIIRKAGIKIGIIGATDNKSVTGIIYNDPINKINSIADLLKEKKNCDLVICLSTLGMKNKNNIDDTHLAGLSKNVDIIIGSSGTRQNLPTIILNKSGYEVLVNHTSDEMAIGKIEIRFDNKRRKNRITYANLSVAVNKEKWNKFEV